MIIGYLKYSLLAHKKEDKCNSLSARIAKNHFCQNKKSVKFEKYLVSCAGLMVPGV